jgi:hypothetical protein
VSQQEEKHFVATVNKNRPQRAQVAVVVNLVYVAFEPASVGSRRPEIAAGPLADIRERP